MTPTTVGWLMSALAAGLIMAAFGLGYRRWRFRASATRVPGVVVRHDFRVRRTRRGYGGRHHPVVSFEVDGVAREVVSPIGQTGQRLARGGRVDVLFRDDPNDAVIDTTLSTSTRTPSGLASSESWWRSAAPG